jgi:NAD(P)-dependent dehydrogenase (short-subunit alcohol dehydrogenase family)
MKDGLLVLTGSEGALTRGSGSVGYTLAKNSVHYLTQSLDEHPNFRVCALLPTTIDTPANRSAMPDQDFKNWTPPQEFANTVLHWLTSPEKPVSGGLYVFRTVQGHTSISRQL